MRWLPRRKPRPGTLREADSADVTHLAEFARTRTGVEGFLEPRTTVTETTMVLVASDGEWTRRRVAGERGAYAFGDKHDVPVYEVAKVGYPARMRHWNELQKRRRDAGG